jgi:phosphate transport system substrate-binding protein
VEGSDTMINVAQAWAEIYHENHHSVSIQISGGGSGVGIASLIDGNCDLADTSRKMKEKELKLARENHHGAEPVEHIVGYDSLAIYVHKDNPIESISLPELAEIYGDGGTITKWSQLGVKMPAGSDTIIRVSRQNSSGTYAYFHDAVLGKKRNYKLGSIDQSGSKDVVTLVSTTPGAIGYSGMGYQTDEVKMVKVSRKPHEPGIAPSVENAQNKTYPITRPLQIYTIGELQPAVQDYLDWIVSAEGQKVVLELGYVPLFP